MPFLSLTNGVVERCIAQELQKFKISVGFALLGGDFHSAYVEGLLERAIGWTSTEVGLHDLSRDFRTAIFLFNADG